jgi:hypothetical protein
LAMGDLCRLIFRLVAGLFRSRAALHAEILVLRHQLNVLRRRSPKRPVFSNVDRLVFATLYGLTPHVLDALKILKPETVIRWHRAGFRAYWRWKSRPRGGRAKGIGRHSPTYPRDEHREPAVGRAADPWRTAQTRHRCRADHRGKIHGEEKVAAVAGLEDFRSQPRQCRRIHGHVRRADALVSTAVRTSDPEAFPSGASVAWRDGPSERLVDRAATDRSLWLEGNAAISHPRPRLRLWRGVHSARWSHGHSRPTNLGALALAERTCGAAHRFDPAGLS